MSADVRSNNPVVRAIIAGTAPGPARMAAARGLLPLAQDEMIEVLVALSTDADQALSSAAEETLREQGEDTLLGVAQAIETSPAVLTYLAGRAGLAREIHEAVALNPQTPDNAITTLAQMSPDSSLLELISVNQQRLIRVPAIIEAVLANPARSSEAERRVRETQREFFEKERGAQQIADELRARGQQAAAEFFETSESIGTSAELTIDDAWIIAEHIEVTDADIDDSWLPSELIEEFYNETDEQRIANAERILSETLAEGGDIAPERVSLIRRVMMMGVKDRIKLGMKGDREARAILIRDSNKVVAQAVIHNPRITDQEVEAVSAMRTVSDEVLRLIAMNRAWARSYTIIHNLARNPRTPLPTAMSIITRLYPKDLKSLSQNRNISDAIRRQANRLVVTRSGSNEKQ